jgi:hypothetical protein
MNIDYFRFGFLFPKFLLWGIFDLMSVLLLNRAVNLSGDGNFALLRLTLMLGLLYPELC